MQDVMIGFCHKKDVEIKEVNQTLGWQISQFNIPELWKTTEGDGVKVAVLDTGVHKSHKDLTIKKALDFLNGAKGTEIDYIPTAGHGTHVCGIIAANNDDYGVVGVAPGVDLYSCRVLSDEGSGGWGDMMDAIDWCITNKMDVINMSLGGGNPGDTVYRKIREAYDSNIAIVCAGGNDGFTHGYLNFPSIYDETIAVAATTSTMNRANFSSVGSNIDIGAPGQDILSTIPGGAYSLYSGTSMAAPFISGLVALIIAKHRIYGGTTPINNVEDIRNHLTKVATDAYFDGQDMYLGNGIVNPRLSMELDQAEKSKDKSKSMFGNSKYSHGIVKNWNDKY